VTEDNAGADDVRLDIGPTLFLLGAMNNGDLRSLENYGPIRFAKRLQLRRLWDRDTGTFDADDLLGTVDVTSDLPREEEIKADFRMDGTHYVLTYGLSDA
jgi:hypothetical protein